ncbi:MAG: hypothetical protein ACLFVU_10165 [Phycisphaerae bacterium]
MTNRSLKMAFLALTAVAALCTAVSAAEKDAANKSASDDKSYAEPPHWPVGFKLPDKVLMLDQKRGKKRINSPQANVLVWVPPKADKIRATVVVPNNTDSKNVFEHDAVRKVLAEHEVGVIYLRHFPGAVVEWTNPPKDADWAFQTMLDTVAKKTGIEEFRNAPFITFGKSSRGRFPFRTTWWFPKRVIASITYHGETPTWPMKDWAKDAVKDESVLHVAINGQSEWSGTWYRHVRPNLLNYHNNTDWLAHQVVLPGIGHGNYPDMHGSKGWGKPVPEGKVSCLDTWNYVAAFIDNAMKLRVPKDKYPTDKPLDLKQVDRDNGLLIHPRAPEQLLDMKWMAWREKDDVYQTIPWPDEKHPVHDKKQGSVEKDKLIRYATDVPKEEREDYMWIPNRELALQWLKLQKVDNPESYLPEKKTKTAKAEK